MTEAVAILNLTPDSFSDGGKIKKAGLQKTIEKNLEAGIKFFDVGAESTRPGATLIDSKEELKRLKDVFLLVKKYRNRATFSIDSRNPETIEKALDSGFSWVNDVSGFKNKKNFLLAKKYKAKVVLVHSLTVPADQKITIDNKKNVIKELIVFAEKKLKEFKEIGINRKDVIFDPGIGFGKTKGQSLRIIKEVEQFSKLSTKILIGHSRKSFLTLFTDANPEERDIETLAVSSYLTNKKVDFLRVHDAISNHKVIKVTQKLFG